MKTSDATMQKTLLLLVIATVCYSFQTGISVAKPKIRVKIITNLMHDHTTEYSYEPSGRIKRIKSSNGNDVAYEYLPGKILRRYNDAGRGLNFIDTMLLNKAGLVETMTSNNPSIITQKREYNKEKYLLRNTYFINDSPEHDYTAYEYRNGNEISNILEKASGSNGWTMTSTYYIDKTNTVGNEELGSDFAGASSKNPIRTFTSALDGSPSQTTNYNYHYDDKGRIIIKASYDAKSGKLQDSVAYSYY